MKGAESFSTLLAFLTRSHKQWCAFTHGKKGVEPRCYHVNPSVQALIAYVDRYALCCRYLDTNPFAVANIERIACDLRVPERMHSVSDFRELLGELREAVAFLEKDLSSKLDRFTCLETQRLDEAIVCLQNYCFYSCVVMAVSSVEARIARLLQRKNKTLFKMHFVKATLGQLVQVFDDRYYKDPKFSHLKQLIPPKHKPLVELLNHYRVFSAHPKPETITAQIAEAVLRLSFTFMIDAATCPHDARELKCK
jgi:hypothetical protein